MTICKKTDLIRQLQGKQATRYLLIFPRPRNALNGFRLYMLLVILLLMLIVLIGIVIRGRKDAKRLNDFFTKATIAHTWLGDEDAKLAALTAWIIVPKRQRAFMLEYVKTMAAILTKLDQGYDVYAKRLFRLYADLSERKWSIGDIADAKRRLREANSEYADALDKGDSGVFVEKCPGLYEVDTPDEMKKAAERINNPSTD